ncbi:esterase [Burkholderia cepacia]|uniref:extracellular catalytic domain type 1 short-chain-length polyhydroxyalkanoate depolymerase n=1 Tax=Burkholderia cepacia TaxID=292 RepID=UPI00075FF2D4|nr:esterase [Burkholderia cepacia]
MPRKPVSHWLKLNPFASLPKRTATRRTAATRTKPASRKPALSTDGVWARSFFSSLPAPGRFVNHVTYSLYRPRNAPRHGPLVVMLHGCKQTAESFALGTRIDRAADRFGFSVLLPEQSKSRHPHRCWNWFDPPEPTTGSDADAIASLIRAIVRQHAFDPARVYVAGMSAGAGLAAQLALHAPTLFAAVALHSGAVSAAARSSLDALKVMQYGSRSDPVQLIDAAVCVRDYPGMPALIVHGERDGVVAKINAEQAARQWLRVNRFIDAEGEPISGTRTVSDRGDRLVIDHRRSGRCVVRVCIVRRLGHAWSGGDARVPFHAAEGPDATAMLWSFFRYRRRDAPASAGT